MKRLRTITGAGARLPGAAIGHLRQHAKGILKKKGAAPGTMVYVGREPTDPSRLSWVRYNANGYETLGRGADDPVLTAAECVAKLAPGHVTWINLDGIHDVDAVQTLSDAVGLHQLVKEDIVHTGQRARVEEYPEQLFLTLHMLEWDADSDTLRDEQLSLVLGADYVLTFQERRGDVFQGVRERLAAGKGTIRARGADYLAYAILDSLVDHYFGVMEAVSDRIEVLEVETLADPDPEVINRIHRLKREMLAVRRAVWPLREVLGQLYRGEIELVTEPTRVFLRDVYDHAVQVIDTVETLRDLLSGLTDLYLTGVSNRMNEVMKVLTIISTIFIPLSFLAGLYGMNFDVMPELHVPWGYPALLGTMAIVVLIMLGYFRRKGWL
jgi:magnesium transporter